MAVGTGCEFSKALNVSPSGDYTFPNRKYLGDGRHVRLQPDRLQWETIVGVPKVRQYVKVSHVASDVDIVPFNNDIRTLQRAVAERVFYVKENGQFQRPPRPSHRFFKHKMTDVFGLLKACLPSTAPISHQQFVDGYKGRKKQVYQQALHDIRTGRSSLERDAQLNVFVKFEKTDHTTKIDPVPRVISPRDPKYNVRLGRYLKPLEERIFKSLGKLFGHRTVIKGADAVVSARLLREKWDRYRNPVAIGLDASRFDQHVSHDALKWEHGIYLQCFRQRKHVERLKSLLRLQLVNNCTGYTPDGRVRYSVRGTRMSGDMNTSLGNCVLMCSMIKQYSLDKGIDLQLANNGDDCVVFMEQSDLAHFEDGLFTWFYNLGFNMQIEAPVYDFGKIEFCQTKPVFDGHNWIMCRNPHTALVKDSVMMQPYQGESLFRGWLDAVGTGGMAMTGGLPVFQEVYRAFQRSGQKREIPQGLLPWSFRHMSMGLDRGYGPVTAQARASFYDSFGITPDEQICLEEYYSRLRICSTPGVYQPRGVFV